MKRLAWVVVPVLIVAASFLAGSWYAKRDTTGNTSSAGRKILYYVDPMHPAYKSDKPGIAPDCNMELVPKYAEEDMGSMPAGTVKISADRQQLLILKFVEGLSNAEVGVIMGKSEGAVKSLYHRTLLALRDEIGDVDDYSD